MRKLFLDFETFYDVNYSLTNMSVPQYVHAPGFQVWGVGVKFEDETEWFSGDDCIELLTQIPWEETAVVCHNALFDAYILTQYYNCIPKYYYDTAAMSRGLYPNESAALKNVCERIFPNDKTMRKGEELIKVKGVRDLDPVQEESIAGYCIQDVDLTRAIFNKMVKGYPQSELDLIDLTVRMFVEPKLRLDKQLLITHKEQLATETAQKIEASGTDRETLASQPKFAAYVESLGITVPTKKSPRTGKMIPAFSKNDSAYIQMIALYPAYNHIWEAREAVKSRIEETRAERLLSAVNPDGSFSVPLRYYAAHTGRFGGSGKINLQNLPRGSKLRNALQAPAQTLLYVVDLSNIEARMLAWLADEFKLLDDFRKGVDIYSQFASQIYGRPVSRENKMERYVGKTAMLGLGYGMGPDKYKAILKNGAISIDVTDSIAKRIVAQYRGMYPNIPNLWSTCKQFLFAMMDRAQYGIKRGPLTIAHNSIRLPNEMYLKYPNLSYIYGDFTYSSSYHKTPIRTHGPRVCENIVQALSRIIITDQMLTITNSLPGINVVLTVHDEIICQGPDKNPNETLAKIMAIMKTPPSWCAGLPLDAEGAYSTTYNK